MTASPTRRAAAADDVIDAIVAAQDAGGAFVSLVHRRGSVIEDGNGCITALVVRALGHGPLPRGLDDARRRALDFLETCESTDARGSFGFWPATLRPAWAPVLPPDADDTAIVAHELHRAGRRSRDWLRHAVLTRLFPFQVTDAAEGPAWVRRGAFQTWLAPGRSNPVDIVVNTNVAAVLAAAGLTGTAAYRAAVATIDAGVAWAAESGDRFRMLAPFYADAHEWHEALAHAVTAGADALRPALREVERRFAIDRPIDCARPVCCSAYGAIVWTAPALQCARAWAASRS